MKFKFLIIGACVLVLAVAVGSYVFINFKNITNINSTANNQQDIKTTVIPTIINRESKSIILNKSGFQPNNIKIKPGTEIIWTNNSGADATINSDPHPTNFLWAFLNLGIFANGENMSAVFEKSGVYTYHNHLNPDQKGTVTVVE